MYIKHIGRKSEREIYIQRKRERKKERKRKREREVI